MSASASLPPLSPAELQVLDLRTTPKDRERIRQLADAVAGGDWGQIWDDPGDYPSNAGSRALRSEFRASNDPDELAGWMDDLLADFATLAAALALAAPAGDYEPSSDEIQALTLIIRQGAWGRDNVVRHLKRIRALAPSSAPGGWQPIKTCPDAESGPVLLWGPSDGEINGPFDASAIVGSRQGSTTWYSDSSDAYSVEITPTHWQPLPPPPSTPASRTGGA